MPDSILLFRPDHIGDFLLTTPAIHAIRQSFPDKRIVLAAGDWSLPLIQGNPHIDEIVPINLPWMERYANSDWQRAVKEIAAIRARKFPVVFNFRKAVKETLLSLSLGIKERWGFRVSKSFWAHTHRVGYDPGKHVVDNYLDLVQAYGAGRVSKGLEIFLTGEEREYPIRKYNLNEPYIVIAPGAGFSPKLWATDRWHLLVKWLLQMNRWKIVITGSSKEAHIGSQIAAGQSIPVLNISGKVTLRELAAIIANASFLITVDSAAMHIGAAMNIPMTALFGPTDPVLWGPYPPRLNAIPLAKDRMEDIELRDVQRAVENLLSTMS